MAITSFYYSDAPYVHALQGLYRALSSEEALIKLIGKPKTGKSTLCEKLKLFMQHKEYRVIYFHYAIESPDLLRTLLARELDLPNLTNFARMLEDVPLNADGKPLILIFDNAHLLSDITLLEIFRLVEVHSGAARKLNIVLCGETLLEQKLARRPELKSLLMHISHNIVLQPMTSAELHLFLKAYLGKAGYADLTLEPAALAYLYKITGGLPGPTRTLCSAITTARAGNVGMSPINKAELVALVHKAQESGEGQLLSGAQYRDTNQWVVLGPVAAVVVIASVGTLYQQLVRDSDDGVIAAIATTTVAEDGLDSPFAEVGTSVSPVEIIVPAVDQTASADQLNLPGGTPALAPGVVEAVNVPAVPVSDSDLVLVTAAERGVAEAEIAEPQFEAVVETVARQVIAAGPATDVAASATIPVESTSIEPTPIELTAIEPIAIESNPVASSPAQLALETSSAVANPVVPEIAPDSVPATVPAVAVVEVLAENARAEILPGAVMDESATAAVLRDVNSWIAAWQGKNLEAYFASYHADFVPRYHSSRQRWQQDRNRVISNARSIELSLSDFQVVMSTAELIEVQFWLDYSSPSYADSTLKKLVLDRQAGRWLILEEVNLQVRG